jgi:CarD family transcriptional regulator
VPTTRQTAKTPAAKAAARTPAKTVKKTAVAKPAVTKPTAKPALAAKLKTKPVEAAKVTKPQAGAAPMRAKPMTAEQTKAMAQKVAAALRAHPESRLARRSVASQQAPATAEKPVKKMPAPGTPAPLRAGAGPIRADTMRPHGELKAGEIRTEMKTPDAQAPEAKMGEAKAVEKPGAMPKTVKPAAPKPGFKPMEFIVYPAHGVGQIIAVEEQEVAGFKLELFVIAFVKDKMILKVPTPKSVSVGMRKLAGPEVVKRALNTLTGRARIKRTMWSRRAQEYEAKINSGDLVAIAEVVRDLYRSDAQPEQSYSERQLYEAALDRVAREIAVVQKLTETESLKLIDSQLQKGPRRGKADEADAAVEAEEGDVDEAEAA